MLWQIFVVAFVLAGKHGCEAVNGKVAITANGGFKVLKMYTDGTLEETYSGSSQVLHTISVSVTQLVAFHARITNTGSTFTAGILAGFNTNPNVVTDTTVKCKALQGTNTDPNTAFPGWQNVGYNDNDWFPAIIKEQNQQGVPSPFYYVPNVGAAKWIWTDNIANKNIICRMEL